MQELCRANDIIFVADEVITGFGRAGAMFASERFGLRPDVMIMAKGMTSGYLPMGATVVGERVWEPFWKDGSDLVFRHGLTYSGHATVCAAAHANLDIIEREGLVDRVRRLETVLHDAVQPLAAHPLVKEVRSGTGLLAAVELNDYATAQRVCGPITERGVLMRLITGPNLHVAPVRAGRERHRADRLDDPRGAGRGRGRVSASAAAQPFRIGVDTGGTFTDLVAVDTRDGSERKVKVPSTPRDPSAAVLEGVGRLGIPLDEVGFFILGTTIATNCLLQRRGQRTVYLTRPAWRTCRSSSGSIARACTTCSGPSRRRTCCAATASASTSASSTTARFGGRSRRTT